MTNPDPKFPPPMSFDVSAIRFPEIVQNKDNSYGVAVPWKDLPATLAEVMAEQVMKAKSTTWGIVNIRSGRVPRLYAKSGDINDLIVFRQRVEAMNMTLEMALIGVPATLSQSVTAEMKLFGMNAFDLYDFLSSNVMLPLGGILICLFVGWVYGLPRLQEQLGNHGSLQNDGLVRGVFFLVRYLTPLLIAVVLLHGLKVF